MNRRICYWKLRHSELQLGERTLIMGILNVTPDSFSDGGRFNDPDRAYARALELEEEGADIIDIGAESTKPGSHRISAEDEWQRLVPVLKRLRDQLRIPLSLDTYKSETAERALEYGIEIINDPSGLTFDPNIARVAAQSNAGLVLSHMRGTPETWAKLPPLPDPADTITRELEATVSRARAAGVERPRIVVDPGLGFGKRKEQNAEVLAHLRELARLECPILIGPSRKAFLAQATEAETTIATAAAVTAGILGGAHIVRVHDVKAMRAAVQIADEVARAARVPTRAEREEAEREEAKQEARAQRTSPKRPYEPERYEPTRPPMQKRAVVEPIAPPALESPVEPAAVVPPPQEPPPPVVRPAAAPREERRPARDGSAPPRRPSFESRPPRKEFGDRPPRKFSDREDRPARPRREGPPRESAGGRPMGRPPSRSAERPGTDRRPGDRDRRGGPPRGDRPFRAGPSGPSRSGPPRGDRPFRSGPSGPPRGDRPDRGPKRPSSGPPRSGPPRSGPPRSGPPRSGPPRGDRPDGPGGRPPKRPFRKRP
jgi:dihydropteroate synthase